MRDLNTWFSCKDCKPDKNGKYLLMVGVRDRKSGTTDIGVIKTLYKKDWVIRDYYIPISWRYDKPGLIEKYPDFEGNRIRREL